MARELAYVLINPYTIAKSRTGGVISRYISRTRLSFVAARMFGPSQELVRRYADLVRHADSPKPETLNLIANYILNAYSPDPVTGKPRRVMFLLFEGEDAVRKVWEVTGSSTLRSGSGQTIRDTYGDYIVDDRNNVQYFEPAVLVGPNRKRAAATMNLWAKYSVGDGGVIDRGADVPEGERVEKTLVLLKPDNFRVPSSRAGSIIDLLSSSGLRIVAVKMFSMSVAQAEQFYGPVREGLTKKFAKIGGQRAANALAREFEFDIPAAVTTELCDRLAPIYAQKQFESIVEFMTGHKPSDCLESEKRTAGSESCLALLFEGVDAVTKIRNIVGPTDPSQAEPGSVRREFGSNIMVNAAHASDSPENAVREMGIIRVEEDSIRPHIERYCGNLFSRVLAMRSALPRAKHRIERRFRRPCSQKQSSIPS